MNRTIVIHQPDFLPYLGFFHRFLHSDLWVIFDDVQFLSCSKSFHNRDKIKSKQGVKWLTVSVQKCPQKTPINQVLLADNDWREKNINLIKDCYAKAPYFKEIMPYIEQLYSFKTDKMIDFNLQSIKVLNNLFDIKIEMVKSGELNVEGTKNLLLINILKKLNADNYLTGIGSKSYLDEPLFKKENIKVIWQKYAPPVYSQINGEFIPYLSAIDLLFNCGIKQSRVILRNI